MHISWPVKTVALPASTRYLHDWHIPLVSARPKSHQLLGKKIKKNKYEWKRGPQRQNRLLYFAIMLRPTQEIHGTGPLLEALPEG